ncbi:MAG: hypothetical protein R6V35_06010 [Candidatus Nanohaloarchaea archaeon]
MSSLPDIQLIFVSGLLDSEIWEHQEKYFSRSCRVETIGGESFEELCEDLEDMLDNCDNAVVIGAEKGNHAVKALESHESVMSTVFTGLFEDLPEIKDERKYNLIKKSLKKPKIFKKVFFKDKTNYRLVKQFMHSFELPSYERYESYRGMSLDVPLKNSLVVYNQACRFSSMDEVERLKSNSQIALLDAGSFSFYERPQEFNKALHDYLQGKKEFLEKRELVKAASENRSLKDFNRLEVER